MTSIDRLTRDAEDGMHLLKRMTSRGRRRRLSLAAIDQHIDLASPFGLFVAQQFVLFADFERALIGHRTATAPDHRRSNGRATSHTPYGFDRDTEDPDAKRLVPNDTEQRVIRRMLRLRDRDGLAYGAIAARLNDQAVSTKRPGGRWTATTVQRILHRRDGGIRPN